MRESSAACYTQLRFALVVLVGIAIMGCALAPTSTPLPTATPTPTPLPALYASAEARECLFDVDCSGLFAEGEVRKSHPLTSSEGWYWIDPTGSDYWQAAVRDRVMPTLEEWTGKPWRETKGANSAENETVLRWFPLVGRYWGGYWPSREVVAQDGDVGGAVHGDTRIVVAQKDAWTSQRFTDSFIYETALHEALHALWYAEHTTSGLMCECYGEEVDEAGWYLKDFPYVLHEVYTLYAHPALMEGMDKATVEEIIRVQE